MTININECARWDGCPHFEPFKLEKKNGAWILYDIGCGLINKRTFQTLNTKKVGTSGDNDFRKLVEEKYIKFVANNIPHNCLYASDLRCPARDNDLLDFEIIYSILLGEGAFLEEIRSVNRK